MLSQNLTHYIPEARARNWGTTKEAKRKKSMKKCCFFYSELDITRNPIEARKGERHENLLKCVALSGWKANYTTSIKYFRFNLFFLHFLLDSVFKTTNEDWTESWRNPKQKTFWLFYFNRMCAWRCFQKCQPTLYGRCFACFMTCPPRVLDICLFFYILILFQQNKFNFFRLVKSGMIK